MADKSYGQMTNAEAERHREKLADVAYGRRKALIIGKFYPPHAGHHYLIDKAIEECDQVVVAVIWSTVETIDVHDRMSWLKDRHPKARIIQCQDEFPRDYSDAGWENHMKVWRRMLSHNEYYPTHLYSSEEYGEHLAKLLSDWYGSDYPPVENVVVDIERFHMPISGRRFREDAPASWWALAPAIKAGLTRRIVVLGAESSGTTTLAKALAEHYKTAWVPEYGRIITESLERSEYFDWDWETFQNIAREQVRMEDLYARSAGPALICDTDLYATTMFSELYGLEGWQSAYLKGLAAQQNSKHTLYIITDHKNVKFEDDGFRRYKDKREWQTNWFMNTLKSETVGASVLMVTGNHDARMLQATHMIDYVIDTGFEFGVPLEYQNADA